MELFRLQNIYAGYDGRNTLENVSLTVSENDFIGVIGPNGGGKTTLLKVILGILKPYSGSIITNPEKNVSFGYLPQNQSFDRNFPITAKEVVLSGLISKKRIFGRYTRQDKMNAEKLLRDYNLEKYINRPLGELSGGQAQRVFLCRSIISDPNVLVLDEPTTYVDTEFEQELYSLLKKLNERMAIIMVSHDIGTICQYIKSVLCVNRQVHYHNSNIITEEDLQTYGCPLEIVCHGEIPHRVLSSHHKHPGGTAVEN